MFSQSRAFYRATIILCGIHATIFFIAQGNIAKADSVRAIHITIETIRDERIESCSKAPEQRVCLFAKRHEIVIPPNRYHLFASLLRDTENYYCTSVLSWWRWRITHNYRTI